MTTDSLERSTGNELIGFVYLLLLGLIVGVVVFPFLSLATQRELYFSVFPKQTAAQGSYATVAVTESRAKRALIGEDSYEITAFGTGHVADATDKFIAGLLAGNGIVYTVQCTPHFWNHCGPLSPNAFYYARWMSLDNTKLVISELVPGKNGQTWINTDKIQTYEVEGWTKRDTIQIPAPIVLTNPPTYKNPSLSFRYPEGWQVKEEKLNNEWTTTIAPPGAHIGTWVTHGLFVGYLSAKPPGSASTIDGAFGQARATFEKRGFVFIESSKAAISIGNRQAMAIGYTEPSPLAVGERGRLSVVGGGNGEGYYYFLTFSPNDEQAFDYAVIFREILNSVSFGD